MAVTLTNDQVRRAILQALYDQENQEPGRGWLAKNDLLELLKVPENQLIACVYYLDDKKLLRLFGKYGWGAYDKMGRGPFFAEITAFGIDVVEHKDQFVKEFPFMQVTIENVSGTIQNIGGNVYGPATAVTGDSNVVTINQQITDAFKQAYDKVKDADLAPEQREEITGQLKDLEKEAQKEEKADVGKIQKISQWLKNNASWITPIISDVVKKALEKAVGI